MVNLLEQINVTPARLVHSKNPAMSKRRSDGIFEVPQMMSRKTNFLSAAAAAVALIASVAVAHTVHTRAVSTDQTDVTTGKVVGPPPAQMAPAPARGNIACGMALDTDCEKLESLLPM
jgi:predicted lysophospholipase L1 biosynthesis ABC-type transport system permease subunit